MFFFSSKETKEILYDQFNFSHKILFTIGHSISGTIFKSASFYSDVQGIAFEAADGENNINFVHSSKVTLYNNKIVNVFSKGSLLTGFGKNCYVTGMLPKRYQFPNVYDTACMTAITCSDNQSRYISMNFFLKKFVFLRFISSI